MNNTTDSRGQVDDLSIESPEDPSSQVLLVGSLPIREQIAKAFTGTLGSPHIVGSVEELYTAIRLQKIAYVFIDAPLPNFDLLSTVKLIDSITSIAFVLARAETDDDLDRVLALEMGADDCVPVSCGHHELKSKFRAFIRRHSILSGGRASPSAAANSKSAHSSVANYWMLDKARCQLCAPSGKRVSLTNVEYIILAALFDKPNEIEDRSRLLAITSGEGEVQNERTLDVYVMRVRKKLAEVGGDKLIETVRGRGYRLRLDQ